MPGHMKASIRIKLDKLNERFEEVGRLMAEPDVHQQQNRRDSPRHPAENKTAQNIALPRARPATQVH